MSSQRYGFALPFSGDPAAFSKFSNLQVNNDKIEIFAIGRHFLDQRNFPHKIRTSIKILRIYFDYNLRSRMKSNFESILKSIRDILNMWKWRGLTLLGRIQIVKSFIIPKVLSKAALIAVTEDLIREINTESARSSSNKWTKT